MVKTFDPELGFKRPVTVYEDKRIKNMDRIIRDYYKGKGEKITLGQAHAIQVKELEKSERVKQKRFKQYIEGAMKYRQSIGKYELAEDDTGIDVKEYRELKPGEKKVTEESKFEPEEMPLEMQVKILKDQLKKIAKDKKYREEINKTLAKTGR